MLIHFFVISFLNMDLTNVIHPQVYQLDFGGRVTQESAKNFQIEYLGKQVTLGNHKVLKTIAKLFNWIPLQNMNLINLALAKHATLQINNICKQIK